MTTPFEITYYLKAQAKIVEQHLEQLLPLHPGPHAKLFEAARYAILGGGKRLRPILALATARLLGADPTHALAPACTLEMIHTYSLIHDDLPCMDDDDFRRGKLSVHRQYREGHAVLTGDFLLTYAFEVLAAQTLLPAPIKIQLVETLSRYSGAEGMIGGQVMDLAYESQDISLETLRLLHRNKTAALITASVEFGGIIAQCSASQMECLRLFGENIGLAFQVVDDILDITSSETKHGRKVASDILKRKSTFVSLMGIDQAKLYALNVYKQALNALSHLECDTSILKGIADFILHRQH